MSCEAFCLDDDEALQEAKRALGNVALSESTVTFASPSVKPPPLPCALQSTTNKPIVKCIVKANKDLGDSSAERSTIFIELEPKVSLNYCSSSSFVSMLCLPSLATASLQLICSL